MKINTSKINKQYEDNLLRELEQEYYIERFRIASLAQARDNYSVVVVNKITNNKHYVTVNNDGVSICDKNKYFLTQEENEACKYAYLKSPFKRKLKTLI